MRALGGHNQGPHVRGTQNNRDAPSLIPEARSPTPGGGQRVLLLKSLVCVLPAPPLPAPRSPGRRPPHRGSASVTTRPLLIRVSSPSSCQGTVAGLGALTGRSSLTHLQRTFPMASCVQVPGLEWDTFWGPLFNPRHPPRLTYHPKARTTPATKGSETPFECSQRRGSHYFAFEEWHPFPLRCPQGPLGPSGLHDTLFTLLPPWAPGPWQVGWR